MSLFNLYLILIWVALAALSVYHVYKRQYKLIIPAVEAFALTFLPGLLERVFDVRLDLLGRFLYIAIIIMTVYLGNGLKYYDKYRWWDRVIHFLSGITFVSFGVALSKNVSGLHSIHILFFSLTLALALHLIWEVLEYIFDSVFRTDNQRWQRVNATNNHQPESALQPAGLVDTMNDSIFCIAGAAVSCVIWWFILI